MSTLFLCAACGSPAVEYSELAGGTASCRACKWAGVREDLAALPFDDQGLSGEQAFLAMYNDFRKIFAQNAVLFLRFLVKWGFVEAVQTGGTIKPVKAEQALRFINAIARGALQGVLNTREETEKERVVKEEARASE